MARQRSAAYSLSQEAWKRLSPLSCHDFLSHRHLLVYSHFIFAATERIPYGTGTGTVRTVLTYCHCTVSYRYCTVLCRTVRRVALTQDFAGPAGPNRNRWSRWIHRTSGLDWTGLVAWFSLYYLWSLRLLRHRDTARVTPFPTDNHCYEI